MAASIETSVWLALRSRIESIPLSPLPPRAYPASTYSPTGAAYLSIGGVSIDPQRVFIGRGAHERNGTLGITYIAPLGQDSSVYTQIAGLIAAHFPDDLKIRYGDICLRVTSYPTIPGGYREGGYWHEPVTIPWQVMA